MEILFTLFMFALNMFVGILFVGIIMETVSWIAGRIEWIIKWHKERIK